MHTQAMHTLTPEFLYGYFSDRQLFTEYDGENTFGQESPSFWSGTHTLESLLPNTTLKLLFKEKTEIISHKDP
ncbi:hypothetical protein RUM43_012285 [Polyplax serrata]|uniref:Uncharacterized protein n=1 Tax=Polyplax serrata TaxID=468196 RepID=A0AAN8RSU4_POLSC